MLKEITDAIADTGDVSLCKYIGLKSSNCQINIALADYNMLQWIKFHKTAHAFACIYKWNKSREHPNIEKMEREWLKLVKYHLSSSVIANIET